MTLPPPLLRQWRRRCARRSPERSLVINDEGVVYGVTRLAKFEHDALVFNASGLLALLSVANGYPVSGGCVKRIRRAGKCFKSGEIALAQMELALTGVPALDSIGRAQRLFAAEMLLKWGDSPQGLLKCAGIVKFNPYHLGPGPGGGQFTTAGRNGASNGLPPGAGRADNSFTLRPSTSRAGETQVAADGNVASDSDSPFPGPNISPATVYLPAFPAAEVAEEATGGLNWIRELLQNNNGDQPSSAAATSDNTSGIASTDVSDNVFEEDASHPLERDWTLGGFKSATKWANQMSERGWTPEQIDDMLADGEPTEAPNYINKENSATRYTDPMTGRFIVQDNDTKEILQISGKGFEPLKLPSK